MTSAMSMLGAAASLSSPLVPRRHALPSSAAGQAKLSGMRFGSIGHARGRPRPAPGLLRQLCVPRHHPEKELVRGPRTAPTKIRALIEFVTQID
jgi:hypothetical protein